MPYGSWACPVYWLQISVLCLAASRMSFPADRPVKILLNPGQNCWVKQYHLRIEKSSPASTSACFQILSLRPNLCISIMFIVTCVCVCVCVCVWELLYTDWHWLSVFESFFFYESVWGFGATERESKNVNEKRRRGGGQESQFGEDISCEDTHTHTHFH